MLGFASQLSLAAYRTIQYSVGTNADVKRILIAFCFCLLITRYVLKVFVERRILIAFSRTARHRFLKVFRISPKLDAGASEPRVSRFSAEAL